MKECMTLESHTTQIPGMQSTGKTSAERQVALVSAWAHLEIHGITLQTFLQP